ncbi:peroxiredoxin [Mucor ambiguus]|uniref:thioredoxin-dependent peroxiredoxin n=1 Tax=Mucor ambiguus TaxID=91626 RepID=A0A0C9N2Z9_9FUNG|nr:peroxiredoxin [Mucor ambiguus]
MTPHALLNKEAPTNLILKDQHNQDVNLADRIGKSTIVLFFYPKDGTFVCTKEEIQKLGADIIGVSADSARSHEQFASKQKLPYTLLADTGGQLRTAYQVPKLLFGFPQRTTYMIDRNGIISNVFESFFSYTYHIDNVLKALQKHSAAEVQTEDEQVGEGVAQ